MEWQRRKGQAASSTARSGGQGFVKKNGDRFGFKSVVPCAGVLLQIVRGG